MVRIVFSQCYSRARLTTAVQCSDADGEDAMLTCVEYAVIVLGLCKWLAGLRAVGCRT